MLKRKALIKSISSNMHSFLKKTGRNLSLPNKKFLRDAINGNFDYNVKEALPEVWLPYFQQNTPIIPDLSDLAKRLAKKMDYLATVRDVSTGELVNGYWLLEVYASLSRKNPVPILLEPFSHEEPYSPGQNPVVLEAVHKIFELTGNRGVLVIDRGLDAGVMFEDWKISKMLIVGGYPNIGDRFVRLSQPLPDKHRSQLSFSLDSYTQNYDRLDVMRKVLIYKRKSIKGWWVWMVPKR